MKRQVHIEAWQLHTLQEEPLVQVVSGTCTYDSSMILKMNDHCRCSLIISTLPGNVFETNNSVYTCTGINVDPVWETAKEFGAKTVLEIFY